MADELTELIKVAHMAKKNCDEDVRLRRLVATANSETAEGEKLRERMLNFFRRLRGCEKSTVAHAKELLALRDRIERLERMLTN